MRDRVCIVTGGTSGIGRAAAIALADLGAEVVAVGRNIRAGSAIARKSRRSGRIDFLRTDLASFVEIRSSAAALRARYGKIDVLVNNAGARFDAYQTSGDGIEKTFALNHLGHFLLTALLLDRIVASPEGRIITVGSGAHHAAPGGDWLLSRENYNRKTAYAASKLANIMFAYELARRLHGTTVTSNAVDPGGVATNLGRNNGLLRWFSHLAYHARRAELKSPRRAARTVTHLASSDALRGITGRYFDETGEIRSSAISHDTDRASQLWTLSVKLTGAPDPDPR